MGQTKPTFRTSERTNERIRRLIGAVTAKTGRRPFADDLLSALAELGEKHPDALAKILTDRAEAK